MKHQYRPEIDGLRAIAVLAVVFYHAGELIPGGYVGVDVFFVISGFLITKVIQSQIDDGSFSIVDFWERRIRRLMPALIVMSATTLALGYLLLGPWDFARLGRSSLAQVALGSNVYFWLQSGYFEMAAETKPLLHTWSLAVEEQFYLVLPPTLIALNALRRQKTPVILAIAGLASFVGSVYGTSHHPSATFYLLPTRAWELLAGSLLAYTSPRVSTRSPSASFLAAAGLLAIFAPMVMYERSTQFPGLAALPPVAGTASVIYATAVVPRGTIQRLLSTPVLRGTGLISYSLYLWHWPALVFFAFRYPDHGAGVTCAALTTSAALGFLSWRWIETPIRRHRFLASGSTLLAASALALTLVGLSSYKVVQLDGLPSRFDFDIESLEEDLRYTGEEYRVRRSPNSPLSVPLGNLSAPTVKFVLWGDSHARCLAHAFADIASENNTRGLSVAIRSTAPVLGAASRERWNDVLARQTQIRDLLLQVRPHQLILVARWNAYLNGPSEIEREPKDKYWLQLSDQTDATQETSADALETGLKAVEELCRQLGTTLIIFRQVPEVDLAEPARDVLNYRMGRLASLEGQALPMRRIDEQRARFDAILQSLNPEVTTVVDPLPYLTLEDGNVSPFKGEVSLYRDNDHLSRSGVKQILPAIKDALSKK